MARPLVIAYHIAWTGYGHWLPNDPRGSGSSSVASDRLAQLGELHHGRKKVQPPAREVRAFYEKAHALLKYPVLRFGPREVAIIADAFAEVIARYRYTCYACAIMPDHVHVVIRTHRDSAELMQQNLCQASREALIRAGFAAADHPVWTAGEWSRFLDHPDRVRHTVRYIRENPVKIGWEIQEWPFVREYDGWPLHPGHNPNSPWARRLRGRK
jgi:REP element-mobilizing transposase RayT